MARQPARFVGSNPLTERFLPTGPRFRNRLVSVWKYFRRVPPANPRAKLERHQCFRSASRVFATLTAGELDGSTQCSSSLRRTSANIPQHEHSPKDFLLCQKNG